MVTIIECKQAGFTKIKRAGMYARLVGKPIALSESESVCNICESLVNSSDIINTNFPLETFINGCGCPHCLGGKNE